MKSIGTLFLCLERLLATSYCFNYLIFGLWQRSIVRQYVHFTYRIFHVSFAIPQILRGIIQRRGMTAIGNSKLWDLEMIKYHQHVRDLNRSWHCSSFSLNIAGPKLSRVEVAKERNIWSLLLKGMFWARKHAGNFARKRRGVQIVFTHQPGNK